VSRSVEARVRDVRGLLELARAVHGRRAGIASAIATGSGLSLEGVELGFASLERDATDSQLRALVVAAGDAERVHVVLSANVFVAPFRAIALARAAATHVTVRPSPRDPALARALLEEAAGSCDDSLALAEDRDVASVAAGEVHVYGRAATIAAVRSRVRPGVAVRGHGPGMGLAVVSRDASLDAAADALALDVVAFDQRGCLSPRVAIVMGSPARAEAFAEVLHASLDAFGARVPRGQLQTDERADASRWRETLAFAGHVWDAKDHAVGLAPEGSPLLIAPAGRHVTVVPMSTRAAVIEAVAPVARFIVAVGSDDLEALEGLVPSHARRSALGAMQRPPLDGPVDRRSA
jgi:hypothetical protein